MPDMDFENMADVMKAYGEADREPEEGERGGRFNESRGSEGRFNRGR